MRSVPRRHFASKSRGRNDKIGPSETRSKQEFHEVRTAGFRESAGFLPTLGTEVLGEVRRPCRRERLLARLCCVARDGVKQERPHLNLSSGHVATLAQVVMSTQKFCKLRGLFVKIDTGFECLPQLLLICRRRSHQQVIHVDSKQSLGGQRLGSRRTANPSTGTLYARFRGRYTGTLRAVPYGRNTCPQSWKSSDGKASLHILELGCKNNQGSACCLRG